MDALRRWMVEWLAHREDCDARGVCYARQCGRPKADHRHCDRHARMLRDMNIQE